jgi:hypothetical protein
MTARKFEPAEIMRQVGEALFGRVWRAELAEQFDPKESMRFINRVMHPTAPTGVLREPHRQQMLDMIDRRMKALETLRKRVADQPAWRPTREVELRLLAEAREAREAAQ